MQGRDPRCADDERRHQREAGGDHFDAPGLAKVLHELFFEGGYFLLLAEAHHHVSQPQIVAQRDRTSRSAVLPAQPMQTKSSSNSGSEG